ncbi:class I SAM-dependent methyltransferase [Oleiagrimonas sp. C23AA]|uniref:class I SAM-dependent methyltransferase n=1 Tax=Oleiagrimonas sp. C23AA TaxID=2719047 RepID=UPI0014249EF9|nr:class I SAM-dependent methyltransferase [Oleiagrimonas sp. C23AA]NII10682.1 class I SAM-dependent methyltransferase [Oleiagrimonas sp. C23AA]
MRKSTDPRRGSGRHSLATIRAILAQILALATVMVAGHHGLFAAWPLWRIAGVEGALALILAIWMHLPRWWWPLELLFVPAVVMASTLELSPWWYAAALALLLAIYGAVFRTGVPLYLSNAVTADTLLQWWGERRKSRVLDIGSGTGTLVRHLACARPHWEVDGIEIAWLPWLVSRWRCRRLRHAYLKRGNFWQQSLTDYDLVYAFLSPVPMAELWQRARAQMREGSWLVSNSFIVPDRAPDQMLVVGDHRDTRLYCYRIGPR